MAESASDIRVKFSPIGVADVIAGLRQIRREAESAATGVAQSFTKGGFTDLFARQTKSAEAFAVTLARMRDLQKGPSTPAFGGDFVNLFGKQDGGGLASEMSSVLLLGQRLIPVLGLAGAAGAVISLGRSALQAASDVSKLQQQFRLSAEEITTLGFAVRTNEATNEDLERGLKGLAKSQRELRAGTEEVVAAYADLGLTARDFQGLNLAQSLDLIAKSMRGIDPTRLNLDTILGRDSRALIPTLNELSEKGLAGVTKEAARMGAVLGGDAVSNLKRLADNLQLAKERADGFANTLAGIAVSGLDRLRALMKGDFSGALTGKGLQAPAKAPTGGAGDQAVQQQIADATKRSTEEQFKALSEQNKQRREIVEATIEGERRIVEARVAGNSNQIEAARQLQAADADALSKRIELAKDFAQRQTDIAKARHEAELQLARQSGTDAGFAVRRVEIDKKAAQERLGIATSLFQDLKRLEADALNQFKASKVQQKTIDDEVAANRRKLEEFRTNIASAADSPISRSIDQENSAIQKQGELVKAVTAGNIDEARRLKGELEGVASALAGGGTVLGGSSGLRVLEEATKAIEPLLAKQKDLAVQQEADSVKAIAGIRDQLKEAEKGLADLAAKPVALRLGLADSELQAITRQIQEQLSRTPFQIAVQPVVQGGASGGFAAGGTLGGSSPGPRSDNLLFAGTAGEYVQPVAAVRRYGVGFMDAVRTGRFPRLAEGGMLGDSAASAGGSMEHYINIGGRRIGPIWAQSDRVTELVDELQRQLAG